MQINSLFLQQVKQLCTKVSNMEDITKSEKAALYYHIIERCNDWRILYAIAIGEDRYNALTDKTKQSNSSKWKTSHRIQKAKEELQRYFESEKRATEEKIKNQILNGETETSKQIKTNANANETDFLNRDEFLKFLNTRANEITDDKLRNDILKMLSDNMRYKESEKDDNTEIQRFYTPITCTDCEIYKRCKGCRLADCPQI